MKPSNISEFEFNDIFYNLVKDKRVVIIGPASYLQGKELGKYLDNLILFVECLQ